MDIHSHATYVWAWSWIVHHRRLVVAAALSGALFASGCSGNLSSGLLNGTVQTEDFAPQTQATGGLRRLTVQQYQNTVSDLLGRGIQFNVLLNPDPTYPGTLVSQAASGVVTSFAAAQQYDLSAHDLASQVFSNANNAIAFVGCKPKLDPNDVCIPDFIQRFGARAWRQPMPATALSNYTQAAYAFATDPNNSLTDPNQQALYGLQQVTAAMLNSPYFLYRSELGTPTADANWRRLTDFELASRLSYLLWNTAPDQVLLDAAAAGELSSPQGMGTQVDRLLASPRANTALVQYFEEWLAFNTLDTLARDSNTYPGFSATLGHSMRGEFDRVVMNLALDPDANFLDIYTTTNTYVNADMAKLYGMSAVADNNTWVPVTLPESSHRAGLLTMGGFLANQAHPTTTAPVLRGLYVLQNVLCTTIGPPPDNAGLLPPAVTGTGHQSMSQILSAHATNPSCAACHSLMDPPGLGLEHFDGIGAYRDTDQGLTINAAGTLENVSFDGGVGLGQTVHNLPDTQACVVREFYRQALGQSEPTDVSSLSPLTESFSASGNNFPALIRNLAASDSFRYVQGVR